MNLSAPKQVTFWVSVALVVLGLLGVLFTIPVVTGAAAFWFVLVGFVLLALGCLLTGL